MSKPAYVWRREPPNRAGKWWWMDKGEEPIIVDVFKDWAGEWCVGDSDDEDECDYVTNWCAPLHEGVLWAGPIHEPVYPPPGTLDA